MLSLSSFSQFFLWFSSVFSPIFSPIQLPVFRYHTHPLSLSFSLIVRQWFTILGQILSAPSGWSVLSPCHPWNKVFWRSSYHLQSATYLYWPKLLHLISHYYILLSIQNRSVVQTFWPPSHRLPSHFLTFSYKFKNQKVLWQQNSSNVIYTSHIVKTYKLAALQRKPCTQGLSYQNCLCFLCLCNHTFSLKAPFQPLKWG